MTPKFFVFAWDHHEASGGLHDLDSTFNTLAEAKKRIDDLILRYDMVEIITLDNESNLIITAQYIVGKLMFNQQDSTYKYGGEIIKNPQINIVVKSDDFIKATAKALGLNPSLVTHIVIDAKFDSILKVYVETLSDKRKLNVDWPTILKNAKVKWGPKEE